MKTKQTFREYAPDQLLLLPPDMREWLPEDHLVWFVRDVVAELDLRAILAAYDGSRGGQPAYDPAMMTALLVYAYCVGMPSSRKIERATYENVPFRVLAADQHPDHDTIAAFRRRHLAALSGLFVQVLALCRRAGLVKLGRVALDGTKVKANASRHKAMSYGRMAGELERLEGEVADLLAEAEATDQAEDVRYGRGKRGDELPMELKRRISRIGKIRQAKAALEAEAGERAAAEQAEYEKKVAAREARGGRGKPPRKPNDKPDEKAQRNFTDPDSRIMPVASGGFGQCYNCQAVVDEAAQVIVAAVATQSPNDARQVEPMVAEMERNLNGDRPQQFLGDAGYFSEADVEFLEARGIDPYLATGRLKHGEKLAAPRGRIPKDATVKQRMARKLRTAKGRATYARRKAIVEPVFGQIKQARGLRGVLLRGLEKVRGEWLLICATHNLLKLAVAGWRPAGT
jgi:transposase